MIQAFCEGGTIVCADTTSQMKIVIDAVEQFYSRYPRGGEFIRGKFILVVDEADSMYRTQEKNQAFEKLFDELLGKNPIVVR